MSGSMLFTAIGCLVAVVSALGVVLGRRPVHSAVALLAHSLSLAGLYLLLGAELVAMAQVLIYSGAIVVLFLFVVALLPSGGAERTSTLQRAGTALIGTGAVLLALAIGTGAAVPASTGASASVEAIGRSLFDPARMMIPFELTAPLLLVAIVGAVTIWRRMEGEPPASGGPGTTVRGISETLRLPQEQRDSVEAGR